jgi:2-methylisocitrate lyase-like PEP mutase family enzyme
MGGGNLSGPMEEAQRERAARFLALHQGPGILLLCNAWDAASARVVETAGFPAIATTSAGVANSLGFSDGEAAPFAEVVAAVRRIVAVVRVPVSADIEAGFGQTPEETARSCRAIVEAGAIGVNLEDGPAGQDRLSPISLQRERIRAAKEAAADLVVNARTDVYLDAIGEPETRFEEAVRRSNAFREAGADCLFVPGVADEETIGRLVQAINGPVNILAGPGSPPIATLARLGVARVSLGSGPMRATLGLLRRVARELIESGTYATMASDAIPYDEANEFFTRR